MNKRLQGIIAGILIGAMLPFGGALAKQANETAKLVYNNIKVFIDGGQIVPKDANGNIVEPFIINGTTYLPVRAISSALGQDVEWDGKTQSVYIGKKDQTKPDNYLHKIQYNDYKEGCSASDFQIINGTLTDYNQKTYTNGILFYDYNHYYTIDNDENEANFIISYPLNSQYENLKGKIVLPKELNVIPRGDKSCKTDATDVWFYGDGQLLCKVTNVTETLPFNFDIDVTGVNQLSIKVKSEGRYIALTDLALYK